MLMELGRKIDNLIVDIKGVFYQTWIYRIYARIKTKRYIRKGKFKSLNHLSTYLEMVIKRGWFSAEESAELIKKWRGKK